MTAVTNEESISTLVITERQTKFRGLE